MIRSQPIKTLLSRLVARIAGPPENTRQTRTRHILVCCWLASAAVIGGATYLFLQGQQARAIADNARTVKSLSLVLSEEVDRALQSLELVQSSLIDQMRSRGIESSAEYERLMSNHDVHSMLRDKIDGLPYVDAVTMISAQGKLINFSRYWPIPRVNVTDRDYFKALQANPKLNTFISEPVRNRGTGTWTFYLARRFSGPNGEFLGLVLGAMQLKYFEDFFGAIAPNEGSAIALIRRDGTLLARYPNADRSIGRSLAKLGSFNEVVAGADGDAVRVVSAIDHQERIIAAHNLAHFPLVVTVSTTRAAALGDWRQQAVYLSLLAILAILAIGGALYGVSSFVGREMRRRDLAAQAQVARAEDLLREAVEAISEGFVLYDADDRLLMCNEAYRRLYSRSAERLVPGTCFEDILRYSAAKGECAEAIGREEHWIAERLRQHQRPSGTVEQVLADGRHLLITEQRMKSGSIAGLRLDITALRATEAQLRQAQKMEAIGQLTGGMAHDFNNLLGIIIGNLDLLRELHRGDSDADEFAGEALQAALRGADLTRRLLAFARRQPLQPQSIDVNKLVAGTAKLLRRTIGEAIEITLELGDDLWPIIADPAQLEASLANLATNARDAMPRGGRLMIATSNRHLDADYAAEHPEVTAGDYVLIEMSDTGTGMPPDVMRRIFEPFYTTKERDKGTGLGLSMVFGFLKQSGGHINVYSEVGVGTTFRLYLPRAATPAPARERAPSVLAKGGGEVVLAVEDNPSLRRVVVHQLKALGYRALEAETATSALALLERENVDLLFTDIVMPGDCDGFELARTALTRWPGIKIVLTSGFPEAKLNGRLGGTPDARLLSKPYRKEDLARLLREVLDQ